MPRIMYGVTDSSDQRLSIRNAPPFMSPTVLSHSRCKFSEVWHSLDKKGFRLVEGVAQGAI